MSSLGVVGARGRLGRRVVAAAEAAGVPVVMTAGQDGWVGRPPDVLVDATPAAALPDVIAYCRRHRTPLLSAGSGLGPADRAGLATLAAEVPVLRAENLSIGHHLHVEAVRLLAPLWSALRAPDTGEVTVLDRHPSYKVDRPSATALALRDCVTGAATAPVEVAVDSVRAGLPVSEHEVRLTLPDEEVVVGHRVRDWAAYGAVAVRAARWLAARPLPGRWTIHDFYRSLAGAPPVDHPPVDHPLVVRGTR
ncbi:dihydrodipicolinate reductase C-terminal domain-containing protein [Micromonospora sp. WMMD1082]|uniref:dihydrodipicolinate reductase C-terminal domain-containing protein n=1 Tax=Micromonospora sp. WMMD1082 TaxID=3016104 RepID=UPI002416863B|nr:dihydrodipicolinate reductase C-terminal domain-containing protein [Micromonospora sp. WMMD1082]MDG4794546.1 dihydrodipicolinate reductase C-terminal domain-containing protein [Micromonospora sp. WMMD1082]